MNIPALDSKAFGWRVREIRQARQMTQRRLAARIGIDDYYVSRLENGHVNPTLSTLQKVADALQVEVRDLISFKQPAGSSNALPGLDKRLLRIMSLWPGLSQQHQWLMLRFFEMVYRLERRRGTLVRAQKPPENRPPRV